MSLLDALCSEKKRKAFHNHLITVHSYHQDLATRVIEDAERQMGLQNRDLTIQDSLEINFSQIDDKEQEQPGANVIEDEVVNIEYQITDIEVDELHQDVSQLPDFESNSRKYTLIMWDLERVGLLVPEKWKFANSMEFARKLLGSGTSVSLESLSKRYGILWTHIHRALPDIQYTWTFIQKMVAEVSTTHPFTALFNFVFHEQVPDLNLQSNVVSTRQQTTNNLYSSRRKPYKCSFCNLPKKNHVCPKKIPPTQKTLPQIWN